MPKTTNKGAKKPILPSAKNTIKAASTGDQLNQIKTQQEFSNLFDELQMDKPNVKLSLTVKGKKVDFTVSASMEFFEVLREGINNF